MARWLLTFFGTTFVSTVVISYVSFYLGGHVPLSPGETTFVLIASMLLGFVVATVVALTQQGN